MKLTERFINIRNNPKKYAGEDTQDIREEHCFRVKLLNAGGVWRTEVFDDLPSAKEYAIRRGGDAIIEEFAGIYGFSSFLDKYRKLEVVMEELEYIPASSWLEAQRQTY